MTSIPCFRLSGAQAGHGAEERSNLLFRTLLRLYWPRLTLQSFWTLAEIGIRCVAMHKKDVQRNLRQISSIWRTGWAQESHEHSRTTPSSSPFP